MFSCQINVTNNSCLMILLLSPIMWVVEGGGATVSLLRGTEWGSGGTP